MHGLQHSIGTGTSLGLGLHAHDVDYCLTTYGLVGFRDMIYVQDNSELEKVILMEFHAKPFSDHLGYQKTLIAVRISIIGRI